MTTLTGANLVAGRWTTGLGKSFQAFDPVSGQALVPDFQEASVRQVDEAVSAATAAFAECRLRPATVRADFLEAIATEIESLGDLLLDRCRHETGLAQGRLIGERARTCGQLRLFAQVVREGSWVDARIDPALPERQPQPRPDLRRMLQPLGPVAVFGASNFPLAFSVAGGDTASALAAGCPVICKGHPAHPGTCELVGGAVARAAAAVRLPAGIFSLLHGGPEVGLALARHPAVTAVAFTGSHAAGRALFDAAAARPHPIPVFAEMSSVNPVVLLPGALQERGAAIAQGLAASIMLGSGQFCTKPGLILLQGGPAVDSFLVRLGQEFDAAAPVTLLTSGIRANFGAARQRTVTAAGVTERIPTSPSPKASATAERPSFAVTTAAALWRQPGLTHEVFGPFALVVLTESLNELIACLNGLEGQLTATLHATPADLTVAGALLPLLEQRAGRLILNGFPTGVEVSAAMNHGGPYPATTDVRFTSVGTAALLRFARPVCYQGFPPDLLPEALRDENPLNLLRLVNGQFTRDRRG